jgi:hypothetical protein
MNKKIVLSGISIVTALTLLGGAVYAQFVVTALASGNTFSSGTPALELCNDTNGAIGDCNNTIPSPINVADLIPGVPQTFAFWMDNSGTDPLSPLSAQFSGTTGTGAGGTGKLETDLAVAIDCTAGGTTNVGAVASAAFTTWESAAQTFTGGNALPAAGTARCVLTVELPSGNTTDFAQALSFNATFSGSDGQ